MSSIVTKKVIGNLKLSEDVVTDIDIEGIRPIQIPFTDFFITREFYGKTACIDAQNATVNNIIATFEREYGDPPSYNYDLNVFIPERPAEGFDFNEFYLNFIILDGVTLNVRFFLKERPTVEIENLRALLTVDCTYHFYENSNGEYTVNSGDNLPGYVYN